MTMMGERMQTMQPMMEQMLANQNKEMMQTLQTNAGP